jgi:hypothetical protein
MSSRWSAVSEVGLVTSASKKEDSQQFMFGSQNMWEVRALSVILTFGHVFFKRKDRGQTRLSVE